MQPDGSRDVLAKPATVRPAGVSRVYGDVRREHVIISEFMR